MIFPKIRILNLTSYISSHILCVVLFIILTALPWIYFFKFLFPTFVSIFFYNLFSNFNIFLIIQWWRNDILFLVYRRNRKVFEIVLSLTSINQHLCNLVVFYIALAGSQWLEKILFAPKLARFGIDLTKKFSRSLARSRN